MVLIASEEHPLAKKASVSVKDLNQQKFVAFEAGTPTRKAVDKLFRDNDISVQVVMEFDNVETVKRAVEINNGVSLVPRRTVTQEVNSHSLVVINLKDMELYRPLAAILKKDKALSPALREFIKELKEE
jgi:DNA-binding transcriptional LysR family regulator